MLIHLGTLNRLQIKWLQVRVPLKSLGDNLLKFWSYLIKSPRFPLTPLFLLNKSVSLCCPSAFELEKICGSWREFGELAFYASRYFIFLSWHAFMHLPCKAVQPCLWNKYLYFWSNREVYNLIFNQISLFRENELFCFLDWIWCCDNSLSQAGLRKLRKWPKISFRCDMESWELWYSSRYCDLGFITVFFWFITKLSFCRRRIAVLSVEFPLLSCL